MQTSNLTYVDTHAHLALVKHLPLPEILSRAGAAGIQKIITVSTNEVSWNAKREIALKHSGIHYSLGFDPHEAIQWHECGSKLEGLFAEGNHPEKCDAIGELGLDFHYNLSPPDIQIHALESQFRLAKRCELPVIIHCRDAFQPLYDSIRRVGLSARGGVMHCFTGNVSQAKEAIDLGLKISFSGILTFKNTETLRAAAVTIPEGNLLLETDCPFLAPVPYRGKPNEPSYLPMTAQTLASLRGVFPEQIAEVTAENATQFFRI